MWRGTGSWLHLHNPKTPKGIWSRGITFLFEVCLHQKWCHPSQDQGGRSLALPQPLWVRQILVVPTQDLAVETQHCSSQPWAGDHTALGAGLGFLYPLSEQHESTWRAALKARGVVCPSAAPHSLCVQVGWLIFIVHQGLGKQVRVMRKESIALDVEN